MRRSNSRLPKRNWELGNDRPTVKNRIHVFAGKIAAHAESAHSGFGAPWLWAGRPPSNRRGHGARIGPVICWGRSSAIAGEFNFSRPPGSGGIKDKACSRARTDRDPVGTRYSRNAIPKIVADREHLSAAANGPTAGVGLNPRNWNKPQIHRFHRFNALNARTSIRCSHRTSHAPSILQGISNLS
jgi:hypothetical protein